MKKIFIIIIIMLIKVKIMLIIMLKLKKYHNWMKLLRKNLKIIKNKKVM